MAITTTTREQLVLGVGEFYVDDVSVGATGQEGSFVVEQSLYFPEIGGARGPVKGTGKVLVERARLEVPFLEVSITNLSKVMPTVSSDSDATSEYTKRENFGYIPVADHKDVKWVGETMDEKAVEIILYDALPAGGVTLNLSDTGESTYTVTFESYCDPADADNRTWKVWTEI